MATIRDLEDKIARQKRELAQKDAVLADRSRQLDAMAWVWCDGGCPGGVFRFSPSELSEDVVETAERNVTRLRRWYQNAEFRKRWVQMTPEEREAWFASRRQSN